MDESEEEGETGVRQTGPPPTSNLQLRADFMLSVEPSGQSMETVRACERALPRCGSLCDPECVGGTGSVGLCHPKASNVFVWS